MDIENKENGIVDTHARKIDYLRLSITDRCNLRCLYCMPEEGVKKLPQTDILSFEEFVEVARAAASLGVKKVRITGGEPLIKRGAVRMVREIAELPGVETVAMTTNGTRLEKYIEILKEAGLKRLNVSLDSLDPDEYRKITRGGEVEPVLKGIDKALQHGFPIKINAVLLEGLNTSGIERLVDFAIEKNVEVRFIEQMSFDDDLPYISQEQVIARLKKQYQVNRLDEAGSSPHVQLFEIGRTKTGGAKIGFISPRSQPFCSGCNKLRLTPNGNLRACLASTLHVDVREVLRRPHTDKDVRQAVLKAAQLKPATGPWTAHGEMWRVGG